MQAASTAALLLFFVSITLEAVAEEFCIDEESCGSQNLGGPCNTGTRQSPIDIAVPPAEELLRLPSGSLSLNRGYYNAYPFAVENNGRTVSLSLAPGTAATVRGYPGIAGTYIFSSAHFHWREADASGSEHTINGMPAALEAHLVHYRSDFPNQQAAKESGQPGAVLTFATLYNISSVDNPALEPIISLLPRIQEPKSQANGNSITIARLLPLDLIGGSLATMYEGSYTTSGCEEDVLWIVFLEPSHVSPRQLEAFRILKNDYGHLLLSNSRSVQKLEGRKLQFVPFFIKWE